MLTKNTHTRVKLLLKFGELHFGSRDGTVVGGGARYKRALHTQIDTVMNEPENNVVLEDEIHR